MPFPDRWTESGSDDLSLYRRPEDTVGGPRRCGRPKIVSQSPNLVSWASNLIDRNRVGRARLRATPELRAGHAKHVAQYTWQRSIAVDVDRTIRPIYAEQESHAPLHLGPGRSALQLRPGATVRWRSVAGLHGLVVDWIFSARTQA